MNSIKESIKTMVDNNFKHVSVYQRNNDTMLKTLNTGVHNSANMRVFPEVEKVEVTNIDEAHDEVKLVWSDLEVKGIMTWRKGQFPDGQTTYSLVSFT